MEAHDCLPAQTPAFVLKMAHLFAHLFAHLGKRLLPALRIGSTVHVYIDMGSCTHYVIADRGGGGSRQMITVLHRGVPENDCNVRPTEIYCNLCCFVAKSVIRPILSRNFMWRKI